MEIAFATATTNALDKSARSLAHLLIKQVDQRERVERRTAFVPLARREAVGWLVGWLVGLFFGLPAEALAGSFSFSAAPVEINRDTD